MAAALSWRTRTEESGLLLARWPRLACQLQPRQAEWPKGHPARVGETLACSVRESVVEGGIMIRLEDAIARGKLARWARRTAVAALLCLPLGTLPAFADSQPSSTYASDR